MEYVLERDQYQCAKCGSHDKIEIHHIIPICNHGTNDYDNLIALCPLCHQNAHDKLIDQTR